MAAKSKEANNYVLYPRLTEHVTNYIKRSNPSLFPAKTTTKDILKKIVDDQPHYVHTLDWSIHCEEYYWRRQGGHILLPESKQLMKDLMRGEQKLVCEKLQLPFNCFSVGIPKSQHSKVLKIPPFQAVLMPYLDAKNYTILPFYDYLQVPRPAGILSDPAERSDRCLTISYRDESDGNYVRALLNERDFCDILTVRSAFEFGEVIGSTSAFRSKPLKEHELTTQWNVFLLIIGIGNRFAERGEDCIQEGLPGSGVTQLINKQPELHPQYSTLI